MVNTGIPQEYSLSPAYQTPSVQATPSLTINHGAALNLDSSGAFEGPEKLLEVWFAPRADEAPGGSTQGLKRVPADVWKGMLDLVNCKVLSTINHEDVDAYLLSESSMFVFPHKLILKTCGTTTLLYGLPRLLEIATQYGGFAASVAPSGCRTAVAARPYRVFYSRKNFLFPKDQQGPHRSWRHEVKSLDNLFLGGSAYMIGKMNGEHWYLYLTEPDTRLTPPMTPTERQPTETKALIAPEYSTTKSELELVENEDETLEILMTDLDQENAKQFYLDHASAVAEGRYHCTNRSGDDHVDIFSNLSSDDDSTSNCTSSTYPEELTTASHALGTVVSETCGLSDVYPRSRYPNATIDAYMFEPCGFSANGVIPSAQASGPTSYFTVHVTPEPHCSYASFETNVPVNQPQHETIDILNHVVDIFKPSRFTVTLFEAKTSLGDRLTGSKGYLDEIREIERKAARRISRMDDIKGYRRIDRIVHDLDGYDLVFRYFERIGFPGGEPRIGEKE